MPDVQQCWCQPTCGKVRSAQTIRKHYRRVPAHLQNLSRPPQPVDPPSDSSDDEEPASAPKEMTKSEIGRIRYESIRRAELVWDKEFAPRVKVSMPMREVEDGTGVLDGEDNSMEMAHEGKTGQGEVFGAGPHVSTELGDHMDEDKENVNATENGHVDYSETSGTFIAGMEPEELDDQRRDGEMDRLSMDEALEGVNNDETGENAEEYEVDFESEDGDIDETGENLEENVDMWEFEDDVNNYENETADDETEDNEHWKRYDEGIELGEEDLAKEEMLVAFNEMLNLANPTTAQDELQEEAERECEELYRSRLAELSEEDMDNLQAFKLQLVSTMPRRAFNQMRFAFQHRMKIASLYRIINLLAILSGVIPTWYHCCPTTCIAYIGKYADHTSCPHCDEKRYDNLKKPRRYFCYIPFIPRLQQLFLCPEIIKELLYRHKYKQDGVNIADFFNCEHYNNLRTRRVTIDGERQDYQYFSGENDIAFSICLDSYLLYKRRRGGPSAMPILMQILNWKPEVRTHLKRLICLGVIPGPKGPKELDTFLVPFEDECVKLAKGVKTFHAVRGEDFSLRGYHVYPQGDIIAIEKLMKLKGHNSIYPCRECKIRGVRCAHGDKKTYYVPLAHPRKKGTWDPTDLPKRRHGDWAEVSGRIEQQTTKKGKKAIAKETGIKGVPGIGRVGSLDFARGVPWDYMHLLLENVVKNLVRLWMGKFKGLDDAKRGAYVIDKKVWETIGKETAAAVKTIPSTFVRSLGNIVEDQGHYTAEGWGFWFMFVGPILLEGRLAEPYYRHYLQLVDIMKTCIQFSISRAEVKELDDKIVDWVETLYYEYKEERLSVCTLTVHGLLHICDNIRFVGPVWATWTFWMERYCGILQANLRSRTYPWANLNNKVLHRAYVDAIDMYYNLDDISSEFTDEPRLVERDVTFEHYPLSVLKAPHNFRFQPDDTIRRKIAGYFISVLNTGRHSKLKRPDIERALPQVMPCHGRVRVKSGGDTIRAASMVGANDRARNATYVRYELLVRDADGVDVTEICYGELHYILDCELGGEDCWREMKKQHRILAIILPCKTEGRDASTGLVFYSSQTTEVAVDLNSITCVVGRVQRGKKWGLIDRSGDTIRPVFITEVEGVYPKRANQEDEWEDE